MSIEDSALGAALRRHRTAGGLTQEELAERAGVSARTISDVERGLRGTIYRDTAERLATALGLQESDRNEFTALARGRGTPTHGQATANIPTLPTRLIGRERELAIVLEALQDPQIRLLTLTGPGGIGKTRIAVEAATRAQASFADGVFFVPLGADRDPGLVLSIVARGLGLMWASEPLIEAIADHLKAKQVLLVLDTFEQLLPAASSIGELLAACPGLTVLVTSRETLHLRGEHEVLVPTLESPGEAAPDDLNRFPATALFIERARAVRPELVLDEDSAGIVTEVCRRLNGLPLAIELAAARVKHLPFAALREHVEHRLHLLTGGPRDLPRRQQTMRDTVAWSYDLLDAAEQALFRRLSVFAGGWGLEGATAVCGDGDDLLAVLSALVDKSLVFAMETEIVRYGMLDVIREYAYEQLEASGEAEAIEQQHARHYLSLAEQAEPELGRAAQHEWSERLEIEHDNLRAALHWSIAQRDADLALRLGSAVWQFWRSQGAFHEGRTWLREALAIEPRGDGSVRAKALWGAAWLAYHVGDYEDTASLSEELLPLAKSEGEPITLRNALTVHGMGAMAQQRYQEALELFEESIALMRPLGLSWLLATSLLNLGTAYVHTGDYARARTVLEDAIETYRKLGDRHFEARARIQLGFAELRGGERRRAGDLVHTGLGVSRDLDDDWGMAEGLEASSAIDAADDHAERAARIAGAADAFRETLAARPLPFDKRLIDSYLAAARASVDERAWQAAWEEGRGMPLDEAIEYALGSS